MAKKTAKKVVKRVAAKKAAKRALKKVRRAPVKKSAVRPLAGSYRVYCDAKKKFVGKHLTKTEADALSSNHCFGGHSIEAEN